MKKHLLALPLASLLTATGTAALEVDAGIPAYEKTSGVSGNLNSVGSDTLANLMTLWCMVGWFLCANRVCPLGCGKVADSISPFDMSGLLEGRTKRRYHSSPVSSICDPLHSTVQQSWVVMGG